ncbi:hypothetical protein MPSEU_000487800 [Mayamaea pseudoterrestris]|nr:hypothetical protein MPSEU_000487800 [Mayamaea pseudoterrestris]
MIIFCLDLDADLVDDDDDDEIDIDRGRKRRRSNQLMNRFTCRSIGLDSDNDLQLQIHCTTIKNCNGSNGVKTDISLHRKKLLTAEWRPFQRAFDGLRTCLSSSRRHPLLHY